MQKQSFAHPVLSMHRIIAISIGLLSTLLLASCGGGGSTDPKATTQSADEGTKMIQAVSGSTTISGTSTGRAPQSKPNTQWIQQELMISGQVLTYTFGSGNPPAVSLPPSAYMASANGIGVDYVTTKSEIALKAFLTSDSLKTLMTRCASTAANAALGISYPGDFDINKWLIIDKTTGRKQIVNVGEFSDWLTSLYGPDEALTSSLITNCFGGDYSDALVTLKENRRLINEVGQNYFNQ